MRVLLDKRVVSGLSIDRKPVADAAGKVIGSEQNPRRRAFIVRDVHPDAPVGFGIRVNRNKRSYVLVRRVGSRVVSTTIGHHPDLLLGKDVPADRNARLVAAEVASRVRRGENPAEQKRAARARAVGDAVTLRRLFEQWLEDYSSSAKRDPRANTVKAVCKAMDRLGSALLDKRADEVTWKDLKAFFAEKGGRLGHLTAAEQTVRWVSAVYNKANEALTRGAAQGRGEPMLYLNPARVFASTGAMRNAAELQRDYQQKQVRRPLTAVPGQLTRWLDAVLAARARLTARTGADYLLLTLLLALRRSESSSLVWSDRTRSIAGNRHPKAGFNVVDLETASLTLEHTKNRWRHSLPLPEFATQLIRERRMLVGDSPFVFPSASRVGRWAQGSYRDPRSLMRVLSEQTGIAFGMHDLRRTAGNVGSALGIPTDTMRQLLNHRDRSAGAGSRYTELSPEQMRRVLQDIEDEILSHASNPPTRRAAGRERRVA